MGPRAVHAHRNESSRRALAATGHPNQLLPSGTQHFTWGVWSVYLSCRIPARLGFSCPRPAISRRATCRRNGAPIFPAPHALRMRVLCSHPTVPGWRIIICLPLCSPLSQAAVLLLPRCTPNPHLPSFYVCGFMGYIYPADPTLMDHDSSSAAARAAVFSQFSNSPVPDRQSSTIHAAPCPHNGLRIGLSTSGQCPSNNHWLPNPLPPILHGV